MKCPPVIVVKRCCDVCIYMYMYMYMAFFCYTVPEPVYLLEGLQRVNMSHNAIKELSSLIDTWMKLVTLDVSFNSISALHVSSATYTVYVCQFVYA